MKSNSYFAPQAYLPQGWATNVLIHVDEAGWITEILSNQPCPPTAIKFAGAILPGMMNAHSHAFQRAMAGLTERAVRDRESFWTWRETMYQFLQKLTPEDQQAIAAQLYVEMLKAGFTSVAEFHYVHHDVDGSPYENRALTSHRVIAAAKEAGIAITHLPVLYQFGGFGGQKPSIHQQRFLNNDQQLLEIISQLQNVYQHDPQVTIGLAHHSLRAVTPEMLQAATTAMRELNKQAPIHIHVAEQLKEVNDCLSWCGQRPVTWLLNNVEINEQWCLVHATHMTEVETCNLAATGAVAGICPTTEANLGDGFFNLVDYISLGGQFAIGSDSHISVSMIEELRWLEYGQRLLYRERAMTKISNQSSIGHALYTQALKGSARALSRAAGSLAPGKRADFVVIDTDTPALLYKEQDFIFDALIFAGNVSPIRHVIAGGRQVIKDFLHENEENIFNNYKKTLRRLKSDSVMSA